MQRSNIVKMIAKGLHFFLLLLVTVESTLIWNHGVNLPTTAPLIISHRGDSGLFPEHTKLSYESAIEAGTDIIECDCQMTADLELICFHDLTLSGVTDIENHPEFAGRKLNISVNNFSWEYDWFVFNFTIAELKTLRVTQRFGARDPTHNGMHQIVSLEEYINIAKSAGRPVGIYPESKQPMFYNTLPLITNTGKRIEDFIIEKVHGHGYNKKTDPCFLQSFSEMSVRYMANRTELPLILLLHDLSRVSDNRLENLAEICYGIGPARSLVVDTGGGSKNWIKEITDLVNRAHGFGIKVHPYTFRNEDRYLAWDYQQDVQNEYNMYLSVGVDGFFTDFTSTCKRSIEMYLHDKEETGNK